MKKGGPTKLHLPVAYVRAVAEMNAERSEKRKHASPLLERLLPYIIAREQSQWYSHLGDMPAVPQIDDMNENDANAT